MSVSNLHDLFIHELQDLYSAEDQLIESLPIMVKATSDEKLKAALQEHLEITKEQKQRLEDINEQITFIDESVVCEGMKGIIKEGDKALAEIDDPETKDAAIISAAQRVEHYEMSGYGTAAEYAHKLGFDEIAELLEETLSEEKDSEKKLNTLAKGNLFVESLNEKAQ